jgi:hypothetical protein
VPVALVERWNGNAWTIQQTPDPLGRRFLSVSCPAANTCTAAGDSSAPAVLSERWNGTEWGVQPTPRPSENPYSSFAGVSCATPNWCEAVGASFLAGSSAALAEGFSLS